MRFSRRFTIPFALLTTALLIQPGTSARADEKTREVAIKNITLVVPAAWKQGEPSNRLRLSEFAIPAAEGDDEAAEMVVYSFGGAGGGADANIKRWVDQFQAEGRKAKVTQGTSAQGEYIVADISGTYNKPVGPPILRKTAPMPDARMLAVILHIEGKGNYFLKLTGPEKTVGTAADALRKSFGGDAEKEEAYESASDSEDS